MTAKYTLYSALALLLLLGGCKHSTHPGDFNDLVTWDTVSLNDRYTHPLVQEAIKEAGVPDSYYTELTLLSPRVEARGTRQLRAALDAFQAERLSWLREHFSPEDAGSLRDTTALTRETLPAIVEGYARDRKAEYISTVEEMAQQFSDNLALLSLSVNQITVQDSLVYDDEDLVSILQYTWEFTGGAHGTYSYSGVIYDLKQERLVTPELLLRPESTDAINALIQQKLLHAYDAQTMEELESIGFYNHDEAHITPNMYLSPEGLTFVYNIYELGAYVLGNTMITLSFDELAPHLSEEYAYLATHD